MTEAAAVVLGNPSEAAAAGESSVAVASVTGAVAVCSIVGNVFVFLTIARSRTLHRINNALILSLAVADVVRSTVVAPLQAALLLVQVAPADQRWLCPLHTVVLVFSELAVILGVTLIAAERLFVITKPLVYQRTVTVARVSAVVASLWIVSLVFGALQALRFLPESDDRAESAAFTSVVCFSVPSLGYAVFDVTLTLLVPLVTLVVCYGKIFGVVHSQMRRIAPVVSDTYGNSEAGTNGVFSSSLGRQTYATRSTSLSYRDSFSVTHGAGPPEQHHRRQRNVFTVEEVASSSGHELEAPITSNVYSAVRPLSNIKEDRVESGGGLSQPTADGYDDRRIRILVTQPSRESFNPPPPPPRIGNDQREPTLNHELILPGAVLSASDHILPDAVPAGTDLEPILSARNLNRTGSVSGPSGAPSIRRGSSVTFDLRNAASGDSAGDLRNDTNDLQRTKRRGSNTATQNLETSYLPQGDHRSLGPIRAWSIPGRSSQDSWTSRTSVNPAAQGAGQGAGQGAAQGLARRNSIARINDNKAFKMAAVVVGTFVVCWAPAKICYLMRVTSGSLIVSDLTFDIVTCLTFVASAIHPYVYNFYSAEFRRALKRLLTCSADKPDMPWM